MKKKYRLRAELRISPARLALLAWRAGIANCGIKKQLLLLLREITDYPSPLKKLCHKLPKQSFRFVSNLKALSLP
jgi:hypothetical protein